MSPAERALLLQRLSDMQEMHDIAEEDDEHADTADAIEAALARDGLLCAGLLREAVLALRDAWVRS